MMDAKTTEKLVKLLENLNKLPSFHGADLFTDDIVDMVGFQVGCFMNNAGRLVFAVKEGHDKLAESFESVYKYKIKEDTDSSRVHYFSTGSDSMYDLSPGTIARLLKVGDATNEFQSIVPIFVMRISEVAEEWKNQFQKMTRDATGIYELADSLYEELL